MSGRLAQWSTLVSPAFWRRKVASWRARHFDRRLGVETCAVVPVAEMRDVDEGLARHAVQYEPSTLPKFERAMRAIGIEHEDYTFIDFGSGKGRVLLLAARFPFRRVIGVEMSRDLHDAAGVNIDSGRRRGGLVAPIERVCADARELPLPEGNLVAYFFNPFDEAILRDVWGRLQAAGRAGARRLIVIYVNPVHRRVFDASAGLACVYDDPAVVVYRGPAGA